VKSRATPSTTSTGIIQLHIWEQYGVCGASATQGTILTIKNFKKKCLSLDFRPPDHHHRIFWPERVNVYSGHIFTRGTIWELRAPKVSKSETTFADSPNRRIQIYVTFAEVSFGKRWSFAISRMGCNTPQIWPQKVTANPFKVPP